MKSKHGFARRALFHVDFECPGEDIAMQSVHLSLECLGKQSDIGHSKSQ
jgi:hypothetical protein